MTLKQLNQITSERKRLALAFRSLLATRNTVIDSFQAEYLRHLKLYHKVSYDENEEMIIKPKSKDSKQLLISSLLRSRNMKKIQKEFLDNKTRIKDNQKECKMLKKTFQKARSNYEAEIIESRKNDKPKPIFTV